ncbi:Mitoferrin [Dactylellina cionopaga]|nr:Mitoferrin [Dactylellina cionopaga]
MLQELMSICDTSGDGFIQFDEFVVFMEATEQHLRGLFNAIDRDKNGQLDRAELAHALESNGIKVEPAKLKAFFDRLDKNNDGQITFEEWSMKAVYSYYLATVNVNPEGDVTLNDDLFESIGFFLAGGAAGVVSRTATAPFDRLKVYLIAQTDVNDTKEAVKSAALKGEIKEMAKSTARPMRDAIRALWNAGGVRSFFAGNGLNVVKVMPESAIKFGSFEAAKRLFARMEGKDDPKQISGVSRFFAGGVGGVVSQFAVYPIDTLKFRMQCEMVAGGPRGNQLIIDTARKLWSSGGFYRGLPLGLIGIFPYSAIDLGTFEWMKRSYAAARSKALGIQEDDFQVSNMVVLAIGATSGSIGASIVYPINLLRTRLQAQGTAQHPQTYTGMWDVTTKTLKQEGFKGLFRGLTPNLLKVVPAVSIVRFPSWNTVKMLQC